MSAVRSTMNTLLELVADHIKPDRVAEAGDAESVADAAVVVRPIGLERIGRSQRDGPVLDLQLAVLVVCLGRRALDNLEALIAAVETNGPYSISKMRPEPLPTGPVQLGFELRVPVSLRLEAIRGPIVTEPLVVTPELIGR